MIEKMWDLEKRYVSNIKILDKENVDDRDTQLLKIIT